MPKVQTKRGRRRKEESLKPYVLQSVLDCQIIEGVKKFLVKWKGCPINQSTWEPEEQFISVDYETQVQMSYLKELAEKKQMKSTKTKQIKAVGRERSQPIRRSNPQMLEMMSNLIIEHSQYLENSLVQENDEEMKQTEKEDEIGMELQVASEVQKKQSQTRIYKPMAPRRGRGRKTKNWHEYMDVTGIQKAFKSDNEQYYKLIYNQNGKELFSNFMMSEKDIDVYWSKDQNSSTNPIVLDDQ